MPDQPLTSDSGSQVATTGAPQPIAPVSPSDRPAPINLHALPEFRQVQSGYEKQLAELRRQANDAKMSGMDDFEKVQYENQQLREQLAQVDAERQQLAEEQARVQQLREISQESGAPISILEQATSPMEAYRLALQYTRQQQAATPPPAPPTLVAQAQPVNSWAQPQVAPTNGHVPDLGSGVAQSSAEQLLTDAQRSGDEAMYVRAIRLLKEQRGQ